VLLQIILIEIATLSTAFFLKFHYSHLSKKKITSWKTIKFMHPLTSSTLLIHHYELAFIKLGALKPMIPHTVLEVFTRLHQFTSTAVPIKKK